MSEAKPQWIQVEDVFECQIGPDRKNVCPRRSELQGKCGMGDHLPIQNHSGCPYAVKHIERTFTDGETGHGTIRISVSEDGWRIKGVKTFDDGPPQEAILINRGKRNLVTLPLEQPEKQSKTLQPQSVFPREASLNIVPFFRRKSFPGNQL